MALAFLRLFQNNIPTESDEIINVKWPEWYSPGLDTFTIKNVCGKK